MQGNFRLTSLLSNLNLFPVSLEWMIFSSSSGSSWKVSQFCRYYQYCTWSICWVIWNLQTFEPIGDLWFFNRGFFADFVVKSSKFISWIVGERSLKWCAEPFISIDNRISHFTDELQSSPIAITICEELCSLRCLSVDYKFDGDCKYRYSPKDSAKFDRTNEAVEGDATPVTVGVCAGLPFKDTLALVSDGHQLVGQQSSGHVLRNP